MSQVIVTKDHLKRKRNISQQEEHHIDYNLATKKWHKKSHTKIANIFTKTLAMVAMPLVAFWGFILLLIVIMLGLVLMVFHTLGKMFKIFS